MTNYAFVDFNPEWPSFVIATNELEIRLRREGRPVAADMLLRAYGRFQDELKVLARNMAVFGTEELRKQERSSRVRPDTQGGGGPRLESFLATNVIEASLLPGSIGIANEDVLEANVPWWITNEIGSSARVGGRLFGTFYGQDSAGPPDSTEFREHPLFEPGANGTLAGAGIIENPIPARHFVEKAVAIIHREWKIGFDSAKGRFDNQLTQVLATKH